jgi:chorismate mutase
MTDPIQETRLREVFAEELSRHAARDLIEESCSGRWDWLSHPLLVTVIGFVLTTGLLAVIEHRLSEAEKIAEIRHDAREEIKHDAQEALLRLDEFVLLINRRATEANLVASAIARGNGEEARQRKERYDEYYREWVTTYQWWNRQLLEQMGVTEHIGSDPFYGAVETFLGWGMFGGSDICLTRLYDLGNAKGFPAPEQQGEEFQQSCKRAQAESARPWREFIRYTVTSARNCSAALHSHGRKRIKAYESHRLAGRSGAPKLAEDFEASLNESCNW